MSLPHVNQHTAGVALIMEPTMAVPDSVEWVPGRYSFKVCTMPLPVPCAEGCWPAACEVPQPAEGEEEDHPALGDSDDQVGLCPSAVCAVAIGLTPSDKLPLPDAAPCTACSWA